MIGRRVALIVVAVLLASALMGTTCQQKKDIKLKQDLSESLCEAANTFNSLVIWRNFEAASLMVMPSRRIDFLVDAEKYAGAVQIENFSVVVCQTDDAPPARDLKLPDTGAPKKPGPPSDKKSEEDRKSITKEEAVDAIQQNPVPETDKSFSDIGVKRPKQKAPKKERVYYGTALVRYINRTILPSATVDTRLIKQYWINVGDVWYCDFEWPELVKR